MDDQQQYLLQQNSMQSSASNGTTTWSNQNDRTAIEEYINSFPPGHRFVPTDLELIMGFLKKKVNNQPLPLNLIPDVNLYTEEPVQLTAEYKPITETEWYFFTPRDKKYPKGSRPSRSTGKGYWKPTGSEKPIHDDKKRIVGYKRTLDFFDGKHPNGTKTDWKMIEFTVVEDNNNSSCRRKDGMRLNEWVLCKIYKKKKKGGDGDETNTDQPQIPSDDQFDEDDDEPTSHADEKERAFEFGGHQGFSNANQGPMHQEPGSFQPYHMANLPPIYQIEPHQLSSVFDQTIANASQAYTKERGFEFGHPMHEEPAIMSFQFQPYYMANPPSINQFEDGVFLWDGFDPAAFDAAKGI
ncbi:hypothetical protein PTKIN_Ptkin13bG0215100 [Pterospermum kingtungense]